MSIANVLSNYACFMQRSESALGQYFTDFQILMGRLRRALLVKEVSWISMPMRQTLKIILKFGTI